jgi:mannosyltransferase
VVGKAAAGDQAFEQGLRDKITASGLAERVIFTGEINAERLPDFLRAMSVLVALPRYEGYGMTPLEGMASGVPFVASDTGYFRSFSDGGRSGRVVALGAVDAAVQELSAILSDTEQMARMSLAARKTACAHYSIQSEVSGIAAVYEALWSKGYAQ